MDLRKLLQDVKDGSTNIDDALSSLKNLPYEDIGYANIDHHREIRNGYPEVIYCEGKSDEHILGIIKRMMEKGSNILGTRCRRETFEKIKNIYEPCGYKVIGVSNLENKNIDKVKEELKDNTVVFAGPSGVGKSSLLNQIDSNFQLKTGDVSDKIKRGKHTTRHAELFELKFGGMVADTPGFSSLTLDDIEDIDLKDYFIEFEDYDDCKFGSRCIHQNEPNCAVKEAVENGEIPKERYESYIQLLNEIRQGKRRY